MNLLVTTLVGGVSLIASACIIIGVAMILGAAHMTRRYKISFKQACSSSDCISYGMIYVVIIIIFSSLSPIVGTVILNL